MILIIMGVAGSGKSTVGRFLAQQLGWTFLDGDDLHPAENVAKMASGIPLTDADRMPWLQSIRAEIERLQASRLPGVIACSALKAAYRDLLANNDPGIRFILLQGTYADLYKRLAERKNHFMKAEMLKSQFEALEITEDLIIVSATDPVEEIATHVRNVLKI